jgi:hypothetical protein
MKIGWGRIFIRHVSGTMSGTGAGCVAMMSPGSVPMPNWPRTWQPLPAPIWQGRCLSGLVFAVLRTSGRRFAGGMGEGRGTDLFSDNDSLSSMNSFSFPTHTKPQSFRSLGYSGKPWVSLSGKRFVETFSINSGESGNFGHASLLGQVAESDQKNMRIFFVKCRRQIFIYFFIVLKIIKGIVLTGFNSIHIVLLKRIGDFFRHLDIFFLAGFIAAKQEQYNDTSSSQCSP